MKPVTTLVVHPSGDTEQNHAKLQVFHQDCGASMPMSFRRGALNRECFWNCACGFNLSYDEFSAANMALTRVAITEVSEILDIGSYKATPGESVRLISPD